MMTACRIISLSFTIAVIAACAEKQKPPEAKKGPSVTAATPVLISGPVVGEEVAVIETGAGKIVLRFFAADAPKTVGEIKRLIGRNFYQGTTFHRVIAKKLIQGGDPLSRDRDPYNDGQGTSGNFIPAEFNSRPFKLGTVGLARGPSPDSGSCQFFISLARAPGWDRQYTAFAEVVEGIEVVKKISEAQVNPKSPVTQMRERPIREQTILGMKLERRKI